MDGLPDWLAVAAHCFHPNTIGAIIEWRTTAAVVVFVCKSESAKIYLTIWHRSFRRENPIFISKNVQNGSDERVMCDVIDWPFNSRTKHEIENDLSRWTQANEEFERQLQWKRVENDSGWHNVNSWWLWLANYAVENRRKTSVNTRHTHGRKREKLNVNSMHEPIALVIGMLTVLDALSVCRY